MHFLKIVLFWDFRKKFQNVPKNKIHATNDKNYISTLLSFIFLHTNVTFWRWPFFSLFWHGITQSQDVRVLSVEFWMWSPPNTIYFKALIGPEITWSISMPLIGLHPLTPHWPVFHWFVFLNKFSLEGPNTRRE